MPVEYSSYPNDALITLAASGDHDAHAEMLTRNIMAVDGVSWDEAQPRLQEIFALSTSGSSITFLPHKIGVVTAVVAGFATFPLCFDIDTALMFNKFMVTCEPPGAGDADTRLEVGMWSWGFMEPPLGQLSFFLLCLQFARAQMENMGAKRFTDVVLERRAKAVVAQYPQYSATVLKHFAKSSQTA